MVDVLTAHPQLCFEASVLTVISNSCLHMWFSAISIVSTHRWSSLLAIFLSASEHRSFLPLFQGFYFFYFCKSIVQGPVHDTGETSYNEPHNLSYFSDSWDIVCVIRWHTAVLNFVTHSGVRQTVMVTEFNTNSRNTRSCDGIICLDGLQIPVCPKVLFC